MSKTNPNEKCFECGEPSYCKQLCKKHYIKKHQEKYFASEKGKAWLKNRSVIIADYVCARTNLKRYLSHRAFIFTKFRGNEKMKNRFYNIESWKQRLQEMDAIFIDQIVIDFQESNLNLECFVKTAMKQFAEMDLLLEKNDLRKYTKVHDQGC